jgi:ATPase subunit of ABC transporter with duplicated ATPase domains
MRINYGRKYVLIGRNGLGKTTILNNIARKEIEGIPHHLQILHVEQETVANDNSPAPDSTSISRFIFFRTAACSGNNEVRVSKEGSLSIPIIII